MLQQKLSPNKLIIPADSSKSSFNPRQKWKRAETRVAVICFPKTHRRRKKEEQMNRTVIESLPLVDAELEKDIDYFERFLRRELIETDKTNELDKFLKFCSIDSQEESLVSEYFLAKSKQFLKQKQLELILDSSLAKRKEVEILDQLACQGENQMRIQRKASVIERNYQSLVKDFARFSFELCSLKSLEHAALTTKNEKKNTK